jgi:predicted nuclease of restriction endonuclease-like (RecB) superfamily
VESTDAPIWQRAVAQLTWGHNVILIQKVKHLPTRLWYAQQAFEHGWSRDVLSLQIQSRAHERHGQGVTNFQRTLPPPQSDLAAQLLHDPYQLTRALPRKLQSALPSIAQLEKELSQTKPTKAKRHTA